MTENLKDLGLEMQDSINYLMEVKRYYNSLDWLTSNALHCLYRYVPLCLGYKNKLNHLIRKRKFARRNSLNFWTNGNFGLMVGVLPNTMI